MLGVEGAVSVHRAFLLALRSGSIGRRRRRGTLAVAGFSATRGVVEERILNPAVVSSVWRDRSGGLGIWRVPRGVSAARMSFKRDGK